MKSFCKHEPHVRIDDIWEPKYSTDQVLIATHKIPEHTENVLLKFHHPQKGDCTKYPDWYWFSAKKIRKCTIQDNGRGKVYCVPMSYRDTFTPIIDCEHNY